MPQIELSTDEIERIRQGLLIAGHGVAAEVRNVAAVDAAGRLVAILTSRGPDRLGPLRNLLP